jgi:hypothetical protein
MKLIDAVASLYLIWLGTLTIATITAFGADNTLGTWKLNVEKSKATPVKSVTMVREAAADGWVKVTNTGERADGTQLKASYMARYDGKEYPVTGTGSPFDTISTKQVNSNMLIDERKKTGGPFHVTVRTVISNGGKLLTTNAKGTNSNGETFSNTLVYERQ